MSFLTGLANLGSGAMQGVDQGAIIRQKAQQIQEAQMNLDQHKKQLQADAMAFSNLGQGGQPGGPPPPGQPPMAPPPPQQGPMAQPMPPGQSSAPPPQPQGQPPGGPPPQGGMPQPPPQMGAGGAPQAPGGMPQQAPGGAGPQQPQGPQPGGQDMSALTDPQAPVKALFSIAQEIKSRNPGIDPQTLMYATQKVVEMSKGLDPAMRQSMMLAVQQLRNQGGMDRAQLRSDTQEDINKDNLDFKGKKLETDDATKRRAQDMTFAGVQKRGQDALDRAKYVQGEIGKRYSTGQGNSVAQKAQTERVRAITAQLSAATRQLAVLKNSVTGALDANDPRVQKANKDIEEANVKLDALEKGAQIAPQGGSDGGQQFQEGQVYTDAGGNKAKYEGGKFVPIH